MAGSNYPTVESETALVEQNENSAVWPALVNVYHEQGYDVGYARAISDVLAATLEATEDFLRSRRDADAETRRLLYDFEEFLENRVRNPASAKDHRLFIDGLGI
jgi:GrpB-like predicted nucleotidyltransferase (UPF0157 family)